MKEDGNIQYVGRICDTPGWSIQSHCHDRHHQLIIVNSGKLHVQEEAEDWVVFSQGQVLFYPCGCRHAEKSDKRSPADWIFIGIEGRETGSIQSVYDSQSRLRMLALWLWQESLQVRERVFPLMATMYPLIRKEFLGLQELDASHQAWSARVNIFMGEHLSKPLTVDDLAAEFSMSKFHFIRKYKERSSLTPMKALRNLRLRHARELIQLTELPLKAIAEQVGLANEYHLSRLFKEAYGAPPSSFRANQTGL